MNLVKGLSQREGGTMASARQNMSEEEYMEYLWKSNQKALRLTDEQIEMAKKDPERARFIKRSPELVKKKIVAEVVKAEHCACHKIGDKIVFEKRMLNKIQIDDKTHYLVLENYVYGRL